MEGLFIEILKQGSTSGCAVLAALFVLSLFVIHRLYKQLMTYIERDRLKSERQISKYVELSMELKTLAEDLTKKLYARDERKSGDG